MTVLVNENSSLLTYALMWSIFDRLLGVDGRDWIEEWMSRRPAQGAPQQGQAAAPPPALPLPASVAEYAGTYVHPGYGTVVASREGAGLVVRRSDQHSALRAVGGDIFEAATEEWINLWAPEGNRARLQFQRDFQGRVNGLRISSAAGALFERQ